MRISWRWLSGTAPSPCTGISARSAASAASSSPSRAASRPASWAASSSASSAASWAASSSGAGGGGLDRRVGGLVDGGAGEAPVQGGGGPLVLGQGARQETLTGL